jgi:exodeoxyribonuclease VII large subunit
LTAKVKEVILCRMSQLPLFQTNPWSVVEITRHIRSLLDEESQLQNIWVYGEVSNCRRPGSGHLYFKIKDRSASLSCVMWNSKVMQQPFIPRDGDAVQVHGSISVFEADGVYQLYADRIIPTGEGILYQEFARLKARLEAEGLFAAELKRPIPRWPKRIGVVTSRSGAALRDILNTLRRRCAWVEVILSPAAVQGNDAPDEIAAALRALDEEVHPDVILMARGGGSIEDLWAFNAEKVARAIRQCSVPVICGIGHETDFTLADFSADLRAATPTAAAELATPDQEELRSDLVELERRLRSVVRSSLAEQRWRLDEAQNRLQRLSPLRRLRSDRQQLDNLERRGAAAFQHLLSLQRANLKGIEQRLEALSPQAVLRRGYAIVTSPSGGLVRSAAQALPRQTLKVRVSDGSFEVQVAGKEVKEQS